MKPLQTLLMALSLLSHASVCLSEDRSVWLTLGGLSHHSNGNYQEVNQGLGYDLPISDHTRLGVGGYRNSYNESSNYVHLMSMQKLEDIGDIKARIGFVYGVVNGYEYNEGGFFPFLFPAIRLEYKHIGAMLTYIPKVNINSTSVIAVQFRYRLGD